MPIAGVAILLSVASTASRNSVPSPGRRPSYHRAASSSSVEASGSFRKGRFIARPTAGRRARARPPTVRQQTHPPSHAWRVAQFHEPTPLQSPPDPSSPVHLGSQEVQRLHRRVPRWARPRLLEEVLALAASCGHSRPERCSPTSGCTRRPRVSQRRPRVSRNVDMAAGFHRCQHAGNNAPWLLRSRCF